MVKKKEVYTLNLTLFQVEQKTSDIYSFLTQAAPFGTMVDTTVQSVIDKMTNRPSPIPKTQKVRAQLFKAWLACLTSSLRGQLIKGFTTLLLYTLIFFVEKMRDAFAMQKLLKIFPQKILANSRY